MIYTRNATCAPIRAEEGITGILTPPNSSTSFCDLPLDQQIGGYPSISQLSDCPLDPAVLDSEGRCVILEFPAFVLIGVYCPANRDEARDEFRLGFLDALDARVRGLVAAGKRVFLTGDLNIIREEVDTANAEEQLRKHGMTGEEYVSTPARRLFNQLIVDGKVLAERDKGRENPILWDICRSFHPTRKGMFTCWDTKKNARPGNFGSRIDYVLCSQDYNDWFCESNIQEGLMGSDHCPVYAVMKDNVNINGTQVHIKDIMNPPGMFKNGVRLREWNTKDLLSMSAKLIPEFDRRRSIRDMFAKKPSLPMESSSSFSNTQTFGAENPDFTASEIENSITSAPATPPALANMANVSPSKAKIPVAPSSGKRPAAESPSSLTSRTLKRSKSSLSKPSAAVSKGQPGKGQSSLTGFFKPKVPTHAVLTGASKNTAIKFMTDTERSTSSSTPRAAGTAAIEEIEAFESKTPNKTDDLEEAKPFADPIVAKESWSKLLSKRVAPRCEHHEPCISLLTKKPGINCGRSFYICPRPLGPSGEKERGTEWRCGTFIWSSDWNGDSV